MKGQADARSHLERRRRRLRETLDNMWRWGFEDAETGGIGELSLYDQHPADLGTEVSARQTDLGLRQNMERMLQQVEKAIGRIESGTYETCERCGRQIGEERLQAIPHATLCVTCQTEVDEPADEAPRRSDGLNPAHVGTDDGFRMDGDVGSDVHAGKEGMREELAGDGSVAAPVELQPEMSPDMQSSDEYARERPGDSQRPIEELSLDPPFGRTFRDGDDYAAYDGEDAWQDVARFGTSNTPQDVPPAVDYDEVYVDADEDRGVVQDVEAVQDISGQGVSLPEIYAEPKRKKHIRE